MTLFRAMGVVWLLVALLYLGFLGLMLMIGVVEGVLQILVMLTLAATTGGTLLFRRRIARPLVVVASVLLLLGLFLPVAPFRAIGAVVWLNMPAIIPVILALWAVISLWVVLSPPGKRRFEEFTQWR